MTEIPPLSSSVCIVSSFKRWIDLYCHHLLSYTPSTVSIESSQDLDDYVQMQQMQSLFSDAPKISHLSFKKITQLKSALSQLKQPHILSISQLSKAQMKSIQTSNLTIKDMQYPKRADLQTTVHMFAKAKNSHCNFTHLLQSANDNPDEILEACDRQHLLNLNESDNQTKTAANVKSFDLLPLIYQMKPQAITNIIAHLTDEDLLAAYWQICKHFYLLTLHPELSTPQLMQLTPWRSLHPQIKIWQRQHHRHLRKYLEICHRIEMAIKGSHDINIRCLVLDLAIRAGQSK